MRGRIVGVVLTVAALGLVSSAAAAAIEYPASLQTSVGNPITDILILESDGTTVHASLYPTSIPGRGNVAIRHDPGFVPVRTLIVGLTEGKDESGNDKTQIVMFLDETFSNSIRGVKYSSAFPGARHSVTIANLRAAVAGDDSALAWFTDTFFSGPAAAASFPSFGTFAVSEFTDSTPIGRRRGTPAPALHPLALGSVALLLFALTTPILRRQRLKLDRFG
jgi:hypothetical protein